MTYKQKAIKLSAEILAELRGKKAPPQCMRFRAVCFLPHPQPDCESCKFYNGIEEARQ